MPGEIISPEQAASLVKSGMWLDYGGCNSQPDVFDKALAARKDELENVKIRSCLSVRPRAVLEQDPEGKAFHMFSWHFSSYDRKMHDRGRCNYTPLNLGEVPDYYRRFLDPIDIAIVKTCPMDDGGYFNFGLMNAWARAVIERSKMIIVEVNSEIPYVFGKENGVHLTEADYVIEGDHQPCVALPTPEPTEVDRAVAQLIAPEIGDGACLQIGIGGMPDAVCTLLADSPIKDLGIHTEMLTDGQALLYRSGRVTGARKTLDPGKVVYTFALGSHALYATANRNRDFYCHQVDYTNSPHIIMQNEKVCP
jgi:acyl-CoA hydrolase